MIDENSLDLEKSLTAESSGGVVMQRIGMQLTHIYMYSYRGVGSIDKGKSDGPLVMSRGNIGTDPYQTSTHGFPSASALSSCE